MTHQIEQGFLMSIPLRAKIDYHGTSPRIRLIGCATVGDMSVAFILVKDDGQGGDAQTQLLAVACVNGVWQQNWYKLDCPKDGIDFENTYQGTVAAVGSTIFVYVLGGDGSIHFKCWAQTWSEWGVLSISGPTTPFKTLDHIAGAFLYATDNAGDVFALSIAGTQWVGVKQDSSFLLRYTDKPLAFLLGNQGYYCALKIVNNALVPGLYQDTGVYTQRFVDIKIDHADGTGLDYRFERENNDTPTPNRALFCIAAWLPSEPWNLVYSNWTFAYQTTTRIDVSEIPGAEPGMQCWVMVTGGEAALNNKLWISIRHDSSASNFTYRPDMDKSVTVSYSASIKGTSEDAYWSFSNASMFMR